MPQQRINPKMLTLARESRGILQNELASSASLTQGTLSRLEGQQLLIQPDLLKKLSKILDYPETLFFQMGDIVPPILSFYRRTGVPQKILNQIDAKVNILRLAIEKLTTEPHFDFNNLGELTPEQAASHIRKVWKVGEGPVENLVELLESKGFLVLGFDFETDLLDSRPTMTTNRRPILIFNSTLLGDRQRFTLARELGHILLHVFNVIKDPVSIGHEAKVFAAEFLMPKREITKDYQGDVDIDQLARLKLKWKTSMQALLFRANDLGIITDNQKRYIITQFTQRGIKRREPPELDVPVEFPLLVQNLVTDYQTRKKLNQRQLEDALNVSTDELNILLQRS
jgi:Zn-dependent peptidase ImmA (M78 family)/DNA-binding Xre family transcriptional regulator